MLDGKLCIGSALKEHRLEYCTSALCYEILSTLHLTYCLHTTSVVHIYMCIRNSLWDLGQKVQPLLVVIRPLLLSVIGCHFLLFSNTNIMPPAI